MAMCPLQRQRQRHPPPRSSFRIPTKSWPRLAATKRNNIIIIAVVVVVVVVLCHWWPGRLGVAGMPRQLPNLGRDGTHGARRRVRPCPCPVHTQNKFCFFFSFFFSTLFNNKKQKKTKQKSTRETEPKSAIAYKYKIVPTYARRSRPISPSGTGAQLRDIFKGEEAHISYSTY